MKKRFAAILAPMMIAAALLARGVPAAAEPEFAGMPDLTEVCHDIATVISVAPTTLYLSSPKDTSSDDKGRIIQIITSDPPVFNPMLVDGGTSDPWEVAAYDDATHPKVFITGRSYQKVYVYEVATGTMGTSITRGGTPWGIDVNNTTLTTPTV